MPSPSDPATKQLLANLPAALRTPLVSAYESIVKNYREGRWEPSELNGGKLCEIVYTIAKCHVDPGHPKIPAKPKNMVAACQDLEKTPTKFPRSVRIQIPRMLVALYEIRNNRGVGHVGGDVDANHMDASCVLMMSKWLMAELIRLYHNVSTDEAAAAVDALVERTVPIVWETGSDLRVLDPKMSMKNKALILLYKKSGRVKENELVRWVEHSNPAVFRRDVLRRAHQEKLMEYDASAREAEISPLGIDYVESKLLV